MPAVELPRRRLSDIRSYVNIYKAERKIRKCVEAARRLGRICKKKAKELDSYELKKHKRSISIRSITVELVKQMPNRFNGRNKSKRSW